MLERRLRNETLDRPGSHCKKRDSRSPGAMFHELAFDEASGADFPNCHTNLSNRVCLRRSWSRGGQEAGTQKDIRLWLLCLRLPCLRLLCLSCWLQASLSRRLHCLVCKSEACLSVFWLSVGLLQGQGCLAVLGCGCLLALLLQGSRCCRTVVN